jgi:iron complex transport system ATP-binding protein
VAPIQEENGRHALKIQLKHLSLSKNKSKILDKINLISENSELICLIGANGAGKTSLLRTIAGLENPTGEIHFDDKNSSDMSHQAISETLSWVPDSCHIPFSYTVLDSVILGRFPWHQGAPQKSDFDKARNAIKTMGITSFTHRDVTSLSAGELQKAMIARSLASDAKIILLDEPCANLDISSSIILMRRLKAIAQDGLTIIMSVHDINLGQRFADRIVCMKAGGILGTGSPKELLTPEMIEIGFDAKSEWLKSSDGIDQLVIY